MMMCFFSRFRKFARSQDGNLSIETALWLPVLLTILGAVFSVHDSWRQNSLNTKAAYAVADALSRETDPVDDAYLDGMLGMLSFLARSDGGHALRVSLLHYDEDTGETTVEWSQVRGGFSALVSAELPGMADRLPVMFDEERVILVETESSYVPPFAVPGLTQAGQIYTFGVTRPRFAPKIVWEDGTV